MYGAVIGDLAGSIYEFEQFKNVCPIKCGKLIEDNAFFSDDTILTMAVLKAALGDKNYGAALKNFGLKYENALPQQKNYFKTIFSPNFSKWLHQNEQGHSTGNGAMMRVSPIGYLFDNEKDVIENARLATIPSHDNIEAISHAQLVARIIFHARQGESKQQIIKNLGLKIREVKLDNFNYTCHETLDVCLFSLFKSHSCEESIKKVISYGGDTDTNACIVGSMAEAMYGIPKNFIKKAQTYLPQEFVSLLDKGYQKMTGTNQMHHL